MDEATDLEMDQSTVKIDLLVDQVTLLVGRMDAVLKHDGNTNTTTVVHKTEGVSIWSAAAVTACFMTFLALLLFARQVDRSEERMQNEIRDLKAWEQVHQSKISFLELKAKEE